MRGRLVHTRYRLTGQMPVGAKSPHRLSATRYRAATSQVFKFLLRSTTSLILKFTDKAGQA